jgi:hypothetical protein
MTQRVAVVLTTVAMLAASSSRATAQEQAPESTRAVTINLAALSPRSVVHTFSRGWTALNMGQMLHLNFTTALGERWGLVAGAGVDVTGSGDASPLLVRLEGRYFPMGRRGLAGPFGLVASNYVWGPSALQRGLELGLGGGYAHVFHWKLDVLLSASLGVMATVVSANEWPPPGREPIFPFLMQPSGTLEAGVAF